MRRKPLDNDDIQNIAVQGRDRAKEFIENEVANDRINAEKFYQGKTRIPEVDGRSKVVASVVREKIRAVKPSLLRVFLSNDKPVEFTPTGPEDVKFAEQATKYIQYKFKELNGYKTLTDAFHDALLKKAGIVKAYWETYTDAKISTLSNLSEDEFTLITSDNAVEVLEFEEEFTIEIDEMGQEIQIPTYSVKISIDEQKGDMCIECIPPEEFFISEDGKVKVHYRDMTVGELVEMGYDYGEVIELIGDGEDSYLDAERQARQNGTENDDQSLDMSMQLVPVSEVYMDIDKEQVGSPQYHRVLLAGKEDKVLEAEVCGHSPFAKFEVEPQPHSQIGLSLADILMDDQDENTALRRQLLDSVYAANNQGNAYNENTVSQDDMQNRSIGRDVAVDGSPMGAIIPLTSAPVVSDTLAAMTYHDAKIDVKAGITEYGGLDPEALNNTSATAANLAAQSADGHVEVMARNLAEGGLTELFKLMLKLIVENCDDEQMMRVTGGDYVPVDPRSWNTNMDVSINVGIGQSKEQERYMALNDALQMQTTIYQTYGPQNGLVGLTNIHNTLVDRLAIGGIKNADRYYQPMDQEREAQMMQEAQANQPEQQPSEYLEGEKIKAQAKSEADMQKLQLEIQKLQMADDRERDQMLQNLFVEAAKIYGQYQTTVDTTGIQQQQATNQGPAF